MFKHLFFTALCVFTCMAVYSQHKVIVCIGSSTTAGQGATPNPNPINSDNPPDSCWASILSRYYRGLGLIDTLVNLGRGGTTTADGLPQPAFYPDGTSVPLYGNYNVDLALTRYNPDVIIVNYPTNDAVQNYPLATTMANLRAIYKKVVDAGKVCWITTSQPRNTATPGQQVLLKVTRDSILNAFPFKVINFYNSIVAADSIHINPAYNFDNTHVNNLGHQQLFMQARNTVILGAQPLAITMSSLTASLDQLGVTLRWTAGDPDQPVQFEIQRSGDGSAFKAIARLWSTVNRADADYSWTDSDPLAGTGFYRIKMSEPGDEHYSPIVSVINPVKGWGIGKIYTSGKGAPLMVEVGSNLNRQITFTIINALGIKVASQVLAASAPSTTVSLKVDGQPAGVYFLRATTGSGDMQVKSFTLP